jgi:drug/metabolite transporter (DMT)-like permease
MSSFAPPGVRESPGRGILWMLLTGICFVGMDTLAKQLTQIYPVPQVVWARYAFHFLLLALVLGPRLPRTLRTRRLGLQGLRSLLLLCATGLFFAALSFIPLADATAIMFVAPIVVTALSMPLLGERVGRHRWASVAAGFLGALIIIRPGTEAMDPAALLALGAASCYALYQVATRRLSATEAPLTTLAYTAAIGVLATSALMPFLWAPPAPLHWLAMAGLGLLGGFGHFALIKAFQLAPAATVTPFGYSNLIWAVLFGYAVFGELPDAWTVTGALVIAGSGLYIVHRERLRVRKARAQK